MIHSLGGALSLSRPRVFVACSIQSFIVVCVLVFRNSILLTCTTSSFQKAVYAVCNTALFTGDLLWVLYVSNGIA